MGRERRSEVLYLAVLLVTLIVPTALAFSINALVDPLWYGGGNRLFAENFPFNERFSKANVFLRDPRAYDCVVLGSSRVTLLDATKLARWRCFNFSVSNGNPSEYGDILGFVVNRTSVDAVVVGVDGFDFTDHGLPNDVPEFVRALGAPPPRIESYLSLDVLEFALKAIVSRAHRTRFYDADFIGDVMPTQTAFVPPREVDPNDPHGGLASSPTNTTGPFFPERAALFRELRDATAGEAEWVGYVPPLLAHHVAHIEASGNLDDYLRSIWQASRAFDRFFDFSVPSAMTSDPSHTYDGSHYFRPSNDLVADTLNGGPLHGSLPVHRMDFDAYAEAFRLRLRSFATAPGTLP